MFARVEIMPSGVPEKIHTDFFAGEAGDQIHMDDGHLSRILDALHDPGDAANIPIEHKYDLNIGLQTAL